MSTRQVDVSRSSKTAFSQKASGGSVVKWEFTVKEYDIGLTISFVPDGVAVGSADCISIQDFIRVKAEVNAFRCPCDGVVNFTLDNTYSVLRGKHVTATVTVMSPDEAAAASVHTTWDSRDVATTNDRAVLGVHMFFNNDFEAAEAHFAREKNRLPVFALGHATLAFMRAMMTFGKPEIQEAADRLHHTLKLSARFMPKESMWSGLFGGTETMSDIELEATVVHAECQLLQAVMFLMDESKIGFVKCAMTVRGGWKLYQRCDAAVGGRVTSVAASDGTLGMRGTMTTSDAVDHAADSEFVEHEGMDDVPCDEKEVADELAKEGVIEPEDAATPRLDAFPPVLPTSSGSGAPGDVHPSVLGGVLFGIGSFNILLSVLPPLVLRIVKALGFPHNREVGLEQLRQCFVGGGVRSILAALVLVGVHVVLPWTRPQRHIVDAEFVLTEALKVCPNGALFLWMAGRLERLKRNLDESVALFERCQTNVREAAWVQLQHLCLYEIGWCRYFQLDYAAAIPLFTQLQAENSWSKAFYAYMVATCHVELGQYAEAKVKFKEIAKLVNRKVAGKLIPPEQYAVRRASEYLAEVDAKGDPSTALILPGLEHTYFFHGFAQMDTIHLTRALAQCDGFLGAPVTTSPANVEVCVTSLDAAVAHFKKHPRHSGLAVDRVAVAALIKACILGNLGEKDAALAVYDWIIRNDKSITRERQTVPYALHDTGLLVGGKRGISFLNKSISYKEDHNYKLRLHMVTHLACEELAKEE